MAGAGPEPAGETCVWANCATPADYIGLGDIVRIWYKGGLRRCQLPSMVITRRPQPGTIKDEQLR